MINILLGPPGGGKSYEAVVYHILPALREGRKVITNLPLNIDLLRRVDVKYPSLIDLRTDLVNITEKKSSWNPFHRLYDSLTINKTVQPFSSLRDYGDPWRHPKTGAGVLYVIDECHKALPVRGTDLAVEEWFAEHRHEFADVLLLTQSYGKVCKAIIDQLQVVYRVKKAVALGLENSYIRKVQDGVKGEVVNETVRRYDARFFQFYKSHTKSTSAGVETQANDIIPLWKRWPFIGMMIIFPLFLLMLYISLTHKKPTINQTKSTASVSSVPAIPANMLPASYSTASGVVSTTPEQSKPITPHDFQQTAKHPFDGYAIHITSFISNSDRWLYHFSVDQGGQESFRLSQAELESSGYTIKKLSNCSALLSYNDIHFFVVCDTSRVASDRSLVQDEGTSRAAAGTQFRGSGGGASLASAASPL